MPIRDLLYSGLIILFMSVIITNMYDALWGVIYIFGNVIVLTFLGWLYQDTWSD